MKGLGMEDKYLRIAYQLESELRRMRAAGITRLASEETLCSDFSCNGFQLLLCLLYKYKLYLYRIHHFSR